MLLQSKKKKEGASLVEIMLAILLLAFLAVAVPTALRHPRALVISSVQKEIAVLAATEALELAKGWNSNDLDSGWKTAAIAIGNRYGLNTQSVSLVPAVATVSTDMKRVSVAVSYSASGGDVVYLETLIFAP